TIISAHCSCVFIHQNQIVCIVCVGSSNSPSRYLNNKNLHHPQPSTVLLLLLFLWW
ncbi:unnamed protein product, partial [Acanthoscelides obtectus]